MKKIFFLWSVIVLTFHLWAQIPNPGFENWTGTPPAENPVGWWTINMLLPMGGVTKSTDAHSGNYAARAQVFSIGGGTNFPGGLGLNDPTNDSTVNGIPFSGMPDTLKLWVKYNTVNSDQVFIIFTLSAWDTRGDSSITVGGGGALLSGTQNNYVQIVIPIQYEQMIMPDSMQLLILVGDITSDPPTGTVGSYVQVDDIELIGDLSVSVYNRMTHPDVKVYPNPSEGHFQVLIPDDLHQVQMKVIDLTGKEVFSQQVNSGLVPVSVKSVPGKYLLTIQNAQKSIVRKIDVK